jgi:hypothetical protein
VVTADRLEQVSEPEQRTDVLRTQLEAALVSRDRLVRERGGCERRCAQKVRLRIAGIECDDPVEALERLGEAVQFLAHLAQVEQREQEIRSDRDRALEQALRLVVAWPATATDASSLSASTLRGRSRSTRRQSFSASSRRPSRWCSAASAISRRSGERSKQRSNARSASAPRPSFA